MNIQTELKSRADIKYADFQAKLIPNIPRECFIGVRTPELRILAKQIRKEEDCNSFLAQLPHQYFDENLLHAFIISDEKDFEKTIEYVEKFLPYVDNWATCDQMSPKVFKKHKAELLQHISSWVMSLHTYTVRFGIGCLMKHFLGDDFSPEYPELVSHVKSDEYYVNMMIAWYFATALAKQYEAVIGFIENGILDKWVHNKTIQKAVESFRIADAQKIYLKSLKK